MSVVQPLSENESDTDELADDESAPPFSAPPTNRHASNNRLERQRQQANSDKQLDLRSAQYLPPGVISGVHGPISPSLMGQSKESKTVVQNVLEAKVKMKATFESRQGKPVEKITPNEISELAPKIIPPPKPSQLEQDKQQKQNEEVEIDGRSFELLAREVYSLLQQRLTIERERYGGYYRDRANRL